jgi:hypothetical protein
MRLAALACFAAACGSVKGPPLIDAEIIRLDTISVTPAMTNMKRGLDAPKQLTATGMLSNADTKDLTDKVTWSSSDPTLATVDDGLVKPLLPGEVTITATFGDISGTATISIANPLMVVAQVPPALEVDVFDAFASGDTAPLQQIKGASTTFIFPWGVQVAGDEIYVGDSQSNAISVFPLSGTGNIAPTRQIAGGLTGLSLPYAMAIVNDEMYVGVQTGIEVFPLDASGNVAPSRVITGPSTGINTPTTIQVYKNEIYVSSLTSQILVFPQDASGDVAPTRTIAGSQTHLAPLYELRIYNDEIFASGQSATVKVFRTTDSGNVAPLRELGGAMSNFTAPVGLQVVGDELYVMNALAPAGLQVFSGFGSATGDMAATRSLAGPTSGLTSTREIRIF